MLVKSFQSALVLSALLSCLVSAFSTKFLTEGMDEEVKTPMEKEEKMKKIQKNDSIENKDGFQGIDMEVIPIVTDVFNQPEDLFNMTPLKLVAAISAQHLITTVKNIPVAGNSYEDSLNMLENVVKEFNKTAEIIKLTAKYVNISGHYMLSTLKEFTDESCDVKLLDEALKSVRRSFLKTITEHAVMAVKELNKKTRQKEISGSDILISSSYHIVSAFQEMTNKVLTLTEESKQKCKRVLPSIEITPPSEEKGNVSEQKVNNIFSLKPIPQQGTQHKSIKKDQAQPKTTEKSTQTKFNRLQYETPENFNNQDLTVEIYSPDTVSKAINANLLNQDAGRNQLRVPEDVTLEYIPLNKIIPQKSSINGMLTETNKEHITPKINNFEQSKDINVKSPNNQDLTVKVFSPETNLPTKIAHFLNQKYNLNKHNDLKMEIIPLKDFLFNNKNMFPEIPKESTNEKLSTLNKVEISQDHDNVNNHKFAVEVLSPETVLSNRKGETGSLKMSENNKLMENNHLSLLQQPRNSILFDSPKASSTVQKTTPIYDRELDSAAVDSLSNVPWQSSEIETTGINNKDRLVTEKLPSSKSVMNIFDLLKNNFSNQNVKNGQCGDQMEPVCGFDETSKKLIIFMNDCKREAHNNMYQTNYLPVNMDSCVNLFLSSPAQEGPLNTLCRSFNFKPS